MNDKLHIATLIVVSYIAYMLVTWPDSPDGIMLSGVIGALMALAGYTYGKGLAAKYVTIGDQEP